MADDLEDRGAEIPRRGDGVEEFSLSPKRSIWARVPRLGKALSNALTSS